ncbi:MAG TPA: SpoIIE family protein phosphatase [Solirubrobacteraceae bacterium]|jgi:anti-sigma regulatory factor (Ser/Thr protein kinase)/putative methionine-R-sulfoxide reductase with GAF domain
MGRDREIGRAGPPVVGVGQIALEPAAPILAPTEQVRHLYRLSDPMLSELPLEELLEELLVRIRDALEVDTAAILLLDNETQELVARAAKGIEEEVERGVSVPLGRGFAGRIAAERIAIFLPDVQKADIHNPLLREKGIRSMLGVPLVVESELVGVLHVGSLHPREFGQKDLAVLQLAAARAAPGIERARLFSALEHEHRVAMLLQRSLLPRALPDTIGMKVAARYLPARDEVGGDWYDVIELPRGLVGLAIGDVVGHGVRAAALMGQLRTALHCYALEGHGPARTLELVDRFVQSMGEYAMATAAYAVFDPETGRLNVATAGHLPPIRISDGQASVLDLVPGAPLGGFPYGTCPERELSLSSGETIVLYTDGLVERRGAPLGEAIDRLAALLGKANSAEHACQLAIREMVPPEGLADDVAILAMCSLAIAERLVLDLPADPQVLSATRRLLRRWLRERGADEPVVTELALAANEACANAIEHAYPPGPASFELSAEKVGEGEAAEIVITVRDTGQWRPPRGDSRGRGLTIIEAAMDQVSVDSTESGTEIVMRRRLKNR